MFSVHTTPEKIENQTITGHLGFMFEETSGSEISKTQSQRFQIPLV